MANPATGRPKGLSHARGSRGRPGGLSISHARHATTHATVEPPQEKELQKILQRGNASILPIGAHADGGAARKNCNGDGAASRDVDRLARGLSDVAALMIF